MCIYNVKLYLYSLIHTKFKSFQQISNSNIEHIFEFIKSKHLRCSYCRR